MVDAGVFERRLAKLEELVADLRPLAEIEKGDFLADHTAKSLAERWTHLATECALDLAHHLIAVRGWSSPTTYRETFQILARHGVLTPELATQMEGWAGLRNVLVHLYLDINHEILFNILSGELDQIENYAAAIAHAAFGADEDKSSDSAT